MLKSPNLALNDLLLPGPMNSSVAGAAVLSNAMRALTGFGRLFIHGTPDSLSGTVPWATNLHTKGVVIAVATGSTNGIAVVFATPTNVRGVVHAENTDLPGLRASHTGYVELDWVPAYDRWLAHQDAKAFHDL